MALFDFLTGLFGGDSGQTQEEPAAEAPAEMPEAAPQEPAAPEAAPEMPEQAEEAGGMEQAAEETPAE